jgi:hypothetical protein
VATVLSPDAMADATKNKNAPALPSNAGGAAEPGLDVVPLRAWRWILIGQLWMLAAFAGMSLVVIAALSAFHDGAGHGPISLLATACAGALLMALAWQGVARMLRHVERDAPRDPEPGARQTPRHGSSANPAKAEIAGMTPSW